jgi:hypothetical protein
MGKDAPPQVISESKQPNLGAAYLHALSSAIAVACKTG